MDYCFDSVSIKDGICQIVGWVTAGDRADRIRIHAVDEKGQEIPVEVTRAARPDVGLAKYGDPKASDVGIFLRIRMNSSGEVRVVLEEIDPSGNLVDRFAEPVNGILIPLRGAYRDLKKTAIDTRMAVRDLRLRAEGRQDAQYNDWFNCMKVTNWEWEKQRGTEFPVMPLFSIVVPLYHTPSRYFRMMVRSVIRQSYPNWELILVNATPRDAVLSRSVQEYCEYDDRIREVRLKKNLGIARNTNHGIRQASGDFICFLDHDDLIEPDALYDYTEYINGHPTAELLYSDEDKVGENDNWYRYPNFKPDFNPDFLLSNNYICHFLCIRKAMLDRTGLMRPEMEGAQDYDLILRVMQEADALHHPETFGHVPRILYHWRSHAGSTSASQSNKFYAIHAGERALNDFYAASGLSWTAQIGAVDGWYTTNRPLTRHPLVSVLIPSKDHIDDLDVCLRSLEERCTYDRFEVIVIENNSTDPETFAYYKGLPARFPNVRVVRWDPEGRGFNYSAINNYGRKYAQGEYLLLLNNDVEVITPDLFENMLGLAMREDVGIVGAKLLYDDHTVQHAGVLVGAGGLADHVFKGIHEDDPGYMGRASCVQDLSAVTAACLMVRTSVYDEVDGLNEDFAVAFNDVDFCLKIGAKGYRIVYDADVKLYHYESKSRGSEDTPERFVRFGREMTMLNERWDILRSYRDASYNPNLSYVKYYSLNMEMMRQREDALEKYQKEHYGREYCYGSHPQLQWKKVLKKVPRLLKKTVFS